MARAGRSPAPPTTGAVFSRRPPAEASSLLTEPVENIDKFVQLLAMLALTPGDRIVNAVIDVVPEHREADAIQGSFGSRQLLQDFNAGSRLLDHAADSTDLPLDAVQAADKCVRVIGLGSETLIDHLVGGHGYDVEHHPLPLTFKYDAATLPLLDNHTTGRLSSQFFLKWT